MASTNGILTTSRNGTPTTVVMSAEDGEAIMETLALLGDSIALQRLAEAQRSIEVAQVTPGENMARIVAERSDDVRVAVDCRLFG